MTTMFLNDESIEDLINCINVRLCYIETGTVYLRANDAITQGQQRCIRALEPSQRESIRRMELLRNNLLSEQSRQRMR